MALCDCPVVDPSRAFFAYVCVRQTVRRIAESVSERDETIAALAHETDELADMVGFKLIAVQQENLFGLIADCLFGKLLGISEHGVAIRKIAACELLLERGIAASLRVFVDSGVHPVPGVECYGSDAITSGN